jgi:hypothetical protein
VRLGAPKKKRGRAWIIYSTPGRKRDDYLEILDHDPPERVLEAKHLVHDTAEDGAPGRGKVVAEPLEDGGGGGWRHVHQDTFEEQERREGRREYRTTFGCK